MHSGSTLGFHIYYKVITGFLNIIHVSIASKTNSSAIVHSVHA